MLIAPTTSSTGLTTLKSENNYWSAHTKLLKPLGKMTWYRNFTGPGHYRLIASTGNGQVNLGKCLTAEDLDKAVNTFLNANDDIENWHGWIATREDMK